MARLPYTSRAASTTVSGSFERRAVHTVSRRRKKSTNDAGRLSKYLARFGLDWATVIGAGPR